MPNDVTPEPVKLGMVDLPSVPVWFGLRFDMGWLPEKVRAALVEADAAHAAALDARSRLLAFATREHLEEAEQADRVDREAAVNRGDFAEPADTHVREFAEQLTVARRETAWRTERCAFLIQELTGPIGAAIFDGSLEGAVEAAKGHAAERVAVPLGELRTMAREVALVDEIGSWLHRIYDGKRLQSRAPDPAAIFPAPLMVAVEDLAAALPPVPVEQVETVVSDDTTPTKIVVDVADLEHVDAATASLLPKGGRTAVRP